MTDEASNFEACQILTDNAENLTMAISKALYCTKSAGIRVPKVSWISELFSINLGNFIALKRVVCNFATKVAISMDNVSHGLL